MTGRLENRQVGVFVVYATTQGATFYDRALGLPRAWRTDAERRRTVDVPEQVRFATKPQPARQLVEPNERWTTGCPCAGWSAEEAHGNDGRVRQALKRRWQRYALTISAATDLWIAWEQRPARDISAQDIPLLSSAVRTGSLRDFRQQWRLCCL